MFTEGLCLLDIEVKYLNNMPISLQIGIVLYNHFVTFIGLSRYIEKLKLS